MPSAADSAWLIPVLPLLGALITGLGLISFNRTINRLKKPVALLLISCIGAAAVISYAVLFEQLGGAPPVEHLFIWACLLYTSPSPRDLSTSRMPSSA